MNPNFSIIIPLFNKENYVTKCIQSVLDQTYLDFEIIIINDGSTDNSLKIVEGFNDNRIKIFTTKNNGVSAARNLGIQKSNSHYLAFLDADDYWEKSFLESVMRLISIYPDSHVFATALKIETETTTYPANYKSLNIQSGDHDTINYFQSSIGHSVLHCANSVFSKKSIEDIGEFDESLMTNEDTDYWIRTGLKYSIVFLNEILATHRYVSDGLTRSNKLDYNPINFKKYLSIASDNPDALKFLTKNMYSSILKLKLNDDIENSNKIKSLIPRQYLTFKQFLILALPKPFLAVIVKFYQKTSNKKSYY